MSAGVIVRLFPESAGRRRPPSRYPALRLFPRYGPDKRWLYAIQFANGITKVGSTSDPRERILTHVRAANGAVEWAHLFSSWPSAIECFCRQAEAIACRQLATLATAQHAKEWFEGVTREDVLLCVREAEAVGREYARRHAERKIPRRRRNKAAA